MNRPTIWKSCIVATLILLGGSAAQPCPLARAEYKNVADAQARLRIGTAPDGDTMFKFNSPTQKEKQVPFAQVIDRVQIKRYNARGRAVGPKTLAAPATIILSGFDDVAGVGDGKWKLFRCRK